MKKSLIILLLYISCISVLSQSYYFEKKSPEAGFAFDGIRTIEEDYNGTIWFGSSNGLYNYDSHTYNHYRFSKESKTSIPNNNVQRIYLDDKNQLWVCTENGFCRFNRENDDFTNIDIDILDRDFQSNSVTNIVQANDSMYLCIINKRLYLYNDLNQQLRIHSFSTKTDINIPCITFSKNSNGDIWLGLGNGDLFKTDTTLQDIKHWTSFRNSPISTICIHNSHVWVGYAKGGIDKANSNGILLKHYSEDESEPFKLSSNNVRKIEAMSNGSIWVATFEGINVIHDNQVDLILESKFNNLPHNSILDLLRDKNNGMWIATWAGGLAHYSIYNYYFKHIKRLPYHSQLQRNTISSIIEVSNDDIYLGTENDGIKTFNLKTEYTNSIKLYNKDGDLINIKSLAIDKNGKIWVGTFKSGIWYKNPGETKFKKEDHPILNDFTIIHKITPDENGLWLCSYGKGVIYYDPVSKQSKNYKYDIQNSDGMLTSSIRSLTIDSKKNIWIATEQGVCIKTPESNNFKNLGIQDASYKTEAFVILETDYGEIWVGTKNQGILVYDSNSKLFKPLKKEWNKDLYEVYNITSDQTGNLWLSTNLGVQMFNPRTEKILYFNENDGVLGKNFSPNAALSTAQGNIIFGGYNGFNIIDPNNITINPISPDVILSGISVNNTPIQETSIKQLNHKNISAIRKLKLPANENTLSFSFVANNYIKSYKNRFKYRLVNYQDEWVDLKTKNEISFTKIPPGKYTLEILGSNDKGVWSENPFRLPIKIKPPLWLSWYAFVIYLMIISTIIYFLKRESYYRINMEKKMMMERLKHESEEQLFADKQKLFTNISHELRTPLSLILSPIDLLIQKFKYDNNTNQHLLTVKRNADRLLHLTNEILDFRLIETGNIRYNPGENDIIEICKKVYNCFTFEALEREINYIFSSSFENLKLNIDNNKIEKVIYNLLSNAFKFSNDQSQILVSIESIEKHIGDYNEAFYTGKPFAGNTLEIKVKNFGKLIPKEQIPIIFDRFAMDKSLATAGSGLGLNISKEYIEAHNGNITVTSSLDNGTIFTVNLPLDTNVDNSGHNQMIQVAKDFVQNTTLKPDEDIKKLQSNIVILLVEDNIELKKYLKNTLESRYKILTASNGSQGYEIAQEIIPDLIISDVKMPIMDGVTLTRQLKENSKTRIIPVILLTAAAEKTDQLKGLKEGADSYLIKPVDIDVLFAKIHNLLITRKSIYNQMHEEGNTSMPYNKSKKKLSFIEKAELIVQENLVNPQFNVGTLAEELDVSRSSLHRKIKMDSGLRVTEFIRDVRMKKTIELMKEGKYNLEEIGTYVGFNSHSYFARTFKKKFGKTPNEFYHDIKADNNTKSDKH